MANKTIILGGTGGIGSATARKLHAQGHALHLVGRDATRLAALGDELDASYTQGDVTDSTLFKRATDDAGDVL